MRRRLQEIKHTDCTARTIFGQRNRYVQSARMISYRNARRNSVHEDWNLGHGGAFRFLYSTPTARSINIHPETLGGIYDPALKAPGSGNDRAFPLYHTDAGQSNSSLAHSIKGVTFCPASFLLSPSIVRYVWFLEENQKRYARNERNVYFSTFTMYLVNQTMPRLLMRTYIQMLSSVKCRLTFSALFS